MKKLLLLVFALILFSCNDNPEATIQTSNRNFYVERLFTVDGCKVYRFKDGTSIRYFTTCHGNVEWSSRQGKTTYKYDIPTAIDTSFVIDSNE